MKMMRNMAVGLVLAVVGVSAMAQSVTFRAGQLTVPPSQVTSTKCVQVGLYMTFTGPASVDWFQLQSRVSYTLPSGTFLAGNPFVNVSDFNNPPKAGLTSPGTVQTNTGGTTTPCAPGDIINRVTLGQGPAINLMTGVTNADLVDETVDTGLMTINISSVKFSQAMFTTDPGVEYLFAIIEFPLAGNQGNGQIDINFVGGFNSLINPTTNLAATTTDGFVQVFETVGCGDANNFVVFDDGIGANSVSTQNSPTGNTLNIDYLDPAYGGVGGQIDATINYASPVVAYQITGDDGTDTGQVMVTAPGSSMETFNPTNAATVYTVTFFVLGLDGVTLVPGSTCTITAGWNPATCTATWTNNGIGGANSTLVVTLTNVSPSGGVAAEVDVPNGATGLTDPTQILTTDTPTSTSGGTATFTVIDQSIPDGSWAGTYTVQNYANVAGAAGATCSDVLGFTCPSGVSASSLAGPATIGMTLDVNLAGSDVLSWDVTYDGVTQNLPSTATMATVGPVTDSANTVTVTGNGVGPDGLPCTDSTTLTLDYVAPNCDSATQNPDSTVTPVDVGTVITLTLVTSGAVSAEIDGVPMMQVAGGATNTRTWEATHVAVADTVVTATIANPDDPAETAECTWVIDINCIDPTIVSVAPIGQTGITIGGTPDCTYTVRITDHINGTFQLYDVTVGADGLGVLNIVVPPDSWIEVGQEMLPTVTDSFRTVPTLGEWGLIFFVLLLMTAGVFFMRKKRLA